MKLPAQSPPVVRGILPGQAVQTGSGVGASQTVCDRLTGLAQQMCYAVEYGIAE